MIWIALYLIVGIILLLLISGYEIFPQPSKIVRGEDGFYKLKDYFTLPKWLWYIVLTIIWFPYIVLLVVEIRNHPPL